MSAIPDTGTPASADPAAGAAPSRAPLPVSASHGLIRRLSWSLASSLSTLATSVVATLAISRLVAPAEYGRVSVTLAAWGLFVAPITWCGWLVIRFGPMELERTGRIGTALATRGVFAAAGVAIGAAAALVSGVRAGWSPLLLALTFAWLVVVTANDLAQATAVAAQRFRATAMANVLAKALPIIVVLAPLAVAFEVRAEHMLAATVAATAAGVALLALALRGVTRVASPDRALFREMWRNAAPALVGLPATTAIAWLDPILLSRYVGGAEVGQYQLAYPVITVCAAVGASLNNVFSPELVRARARGESVARSAFVTAHHPRLALALGFAAFSAACVAEPLVRGVIGGAFAPSARLVAILLVAGGFQLAATSLYSVVTAADAQARAQVVNVVQAITNVVGDVALGARFGAVGVAVANVGAWAVSGALLALTLRGRGVSARPFLWLWAAAPAALAVVFLAAPGGVVAVLAAAGFAVPAGAAGLALRRRRATPEKDST